MGDDTLINTGTSFEPFYSKQSYRLRAKPGLHLQTLCIETLIDILKGTDFKSEQKANSIEEIQRYFYNQFPKVLQKTLMLTAAEVRHLNVQSMLNIFESLGPAWVGKEFLDLTRGYTGNDWCHKPGHWRWGNASEWCMTRKQCLQLFHILSLGNPSSLRRLSLCAFKEALTESKLPSTFARAHLLQDITLLCGATDHILRILGINCPLLKKMYLHGSDAVTDKGLKNFFLQYPRRKSDSRNAVADSIEEIQVFRTAITTAGCEFACRQMNRGYIIPMLPNNGIYRSPPLTQALGLHMANSSGGAESQLETLGMDPVLAKSLSDAVNLVKATDSNENPVLDIYGEESTRKVFFREHKSLLVKAVFKCCMNTITEFTHTWNTLGEWNWDWQGPPSIQGLMVAMPCLRRLTSRVGGYWRGESPMFPCLEYAEIWVVDYVTLLSFLRWAPALKIFDCRFVGSDGLLSDWELLELLTANTKLTESLLEFNVRPTMLTMYGTIMLIQKCPNLKCIGDLENWSVEPDNLDLLNRFLDSINSQCVLKICNFPPVNITIT